MKHQHELLYKLSPNLYEWGYQASKYGVMNNLSSASLFASGAIQKLSKCNVNTTKGILDTVFGFNYMGINIRPQQHRKEFEEFSNFLSTFAIERVLEIGSAMGGTLFTFTKIAKPGALVISLDYKGYLPWRSKLYSSFGNNMYLISGDSHLQTSFNNVKDILGKQEVDFMFIDGDHTYEGAKKDFDMYSPLVRKGGLIAFHDIITSENPPPQVKTLWGELKQLHKYRDCLIITCHLINLSSSSSQD